MNLWIVGSGTLVPNEARGGPAHWVEAGGLECLMDCGPGTLRTLARLRLPWTRVSHVFLSHFHTDHVADLAPLLFALEHGCDPPRVMPLHLLGPPGLSDHLDGLAAAHGAFIRNPGFPVVVTELAREEAWRSPDGLVQVRTAHTPHTESSLSFRLEADGSALGYTGDTGPAAWLGTFFRGCAVLIAECSLLDARGMDLHLTPSTLASVAQVARPEVLITVHTYPPLDPDDVPRLLLQAGYTGEVRAGIDGLRVELDGESVIVKNPPEDAPRPA